MKTDNCCCCCKLETGGLIWGWLHIIILSIFLLIMIFVVPFYFPKCDEKSVAKMEDKAIDEMLEEKNITQGMPDDDKKLITGMSEDLGKALLKDKEEEMEFLCRYDRSVVIKSYIALLVAAFISLAIYGLLIRGIQVRNYVFVVPATVLVGIIGVVGVLGGLFSFTLHGLALAIIDGIIYGYIFLCLYSLTIQLRDELKRREEYVQP